MQLALELGAEVEFLLHHPRKGSALFREELLIYPE